MRIAQIAPLIERVPPSCYGGTERVVWWLTEELVRLGHDVTLYATADSLTNARLVPGTASALRTGPSGIDHVAPHLLMAHDVVRDASRFDVLHFHLDYLHLPLLDHVRTPALTTQHGRLDLPHLGPIFNTFAHHPFVSISDAQRRPQRHAWWLRTVHHGLPTETFAMGSGKGDYFAFIGRISPEKGLDRAIEIARRVGKRLVIGAKVDRADEAYFRAAIEPLLSAPGIDYLGEIDDARKQQVLGDALALLFPINWPEPFGLVMIEALACGTPVIAFDHGSVREIVEPGLTGFVVHSVDEAVAAARRADRLSRLVCRRQFEARFSATRMAREYLSLYDRLAEHRTLLRGTVTTGVTCPTSSVSTNSSPS